MTVRVLPLAQSDFVPIAETDIYVAAAPTIIDKCNSASVLAGVVTLRIVPSGSASLANHQQAKHQFVVDDGYTWPEIVGQILATGDRITASATVATAVTLRLSGRQVTND
jgi:hypothetical protein